LLQIIQAIIYLYKLLLSFFSRLDQLNLFSTIQ
jgi:hypothetical protein